MPYPIVTYPTGKTITYNLGTGMHDLTSLLNGNGFTAASITAYQTGGRANATPIPAALTLIAVAGAIAASVALPPATGGQLLWVTNGGANSAQVFAAVGTSDTINGVAAGTGIALAAGKSQVFISPIAGAWFGVLSA